MLVQAKAQEVAAGATCTVKTMTMISTVNSLSSLDQTPNQATLYRENPMFSGLSASSFLSQNSVAARQTLYRECFLQTHKYRQMFSWEADRELTRRGTNLISEKFLF